MTIGADDPGAGATVPAVSVVIIFLNGAAFLHEAINSVRAQSVTDWELVLVDDGSTDGSTAIAAAAAAADPRRVRVLEHEGHVNRGTSASRELGLRSARGTFLLYLDCDDILFTDALATLLEALRRHPGTDAALAGTLFWYWHPDFSAERDSRQALRRWQGLHRAPHLLTAMTRDEYMHPANCSSLFRRNALVELGGFEAEFTGMYEDTVLLAKVLLERPVVLLDVCVSAYRMHPASQCHRAAASGTYEILQPNRDRVRYLRWLRTHVRRRGVRDVPLRLMIEREIGRFEWPAAERLGRFARRALRRARRLGRAVMAGAVRERSPAVAAAVDTGEASTARAIEMLAEALEMSGVPAEAAALRVRLRARESGRSLLSGG